MSTFEHLKAMVQGMSRNEVIARLSVKKDEANRIRQIATDCNLDLPSILAMTHEEREAQLVYLNQKKAEAMAKIAELKRKIESYQQDDNDVAPTAHNEDGDDGAPTAHNEVGDNGAPTAQKQIDEGVTPAPKQDKDEVALTDHKQDGDDNAEPPLKKNKNE
jgi:hypothetical protein